MDYRIGLGTDIHRLVEGRSLILGGVRIESPKGLLGHSDADALLHALTDALLGAVGAGDIGELFPDTADENKNRDSRDFVREALRRVREAGYEVGNVDATVTAEKPKLSPYKREIARAIAELCGVAEDRVNLKAKTNEKLDAIGAGEALAAQAVVLVRRMKAEG